MTRHRLPHEMDNPLLSLHPERTTTMPVDYSTPEFPAELYPPDYPWSVLYDLYVAHTTLLDLNDEQGAEWYVDQARILVQRYHAVSAPWVEIIAQDFANRIL